MITGCTSHRHSEIGFLAPIINKEWAPNMHGNPPKNKEETMGKAYFCYMKCKYEGSSMGILQRV